ncbi:MAG TPA: hypothetical protein VHQ65_01590 [Thermoanaerobaculia bacterium]|nr:hypothetical protein [Thermoanaerobaculia bacterium]
MPLRLLVAILLPALLAPTALSETFTYEDRLRSSGDFEPRIVDGQILPSLERAGYRGLSFWVDRYGTYTITSDQRIFEDGFDGLLALYLGPLEDRNQPLDDLLAVADGPTGSTEMTVTLTPGVLYYLVTTFARPSGPDGFTFDFTNTITGPGRIRWSGCNAPPDSTHFFDFGTDMNLLEDTFCALVEWKDFAGNLSVGRTVAFRSDRSGQFWFFDEENWEVQVKLVNGCAVNGHVWVFVAATTNVEFDLTVLEQRSPGNARTYHNPLGQTAQTVTDTTAFPCADLTRVPGD